MNLIQNVTSNSFQQQTLILDDGSSLLLQMYFMPMQYAWVITKLVYKDFVLNGQRIVVSPNMLQQYRNEIPFGLACFSQNNREPTQQLDFSSGAAKLYILSSTEVEAYEAVLVNGANA